MTGRFYIYKTTNNINCKIYIGMHYSEDIENDTYMGSGKYIKKAIRKYGIKNFSREILFEYDNSIDASNKERELVNEDFLKGRVYNVSIGGIGSGLIGSLNPFFGKKHSKETLEKISRINSGKKLSTEEKEKISKGLRRSEKFKLSFEDPTRSVRMMETKRFRYPEVYNNSPKVKLTTEERGNIIRNWIENNPEKHKARMDKINKNPEKIAKMVAKQTGRAQTQKRKDNISKSLIGKSKGVKNGNFKGYYHTPYGEFSSLKDASDATGNSIVCIRDRCVVKTNNKVIKRSIDVDSKLTEDMIGKTWTELGWYFIEAKK